MYSIEMNTGRMPKIDMEIQQIDGMAESDYLKKPELPKSNEKPVKKKRQMSEKQLANLARARKISAEKRKERKEAKAQEKKIAKANRKVKIVEPEPQELEPIEEESRDEPDVEEEEAEEEYISYPTKHSNAIDYDYIIDGVFDLIQEDKKRRRPLKEDKLKAMFQSEEKVRMDERQKILGLVNQMADAEKTKNTQAPSASNILRRGNNVNWDDCFAPRRGGGNGGGLW